MNKPQYSNERIETLPDEVTTKAMLLSNNLVREWEEGGSLWQIYAIPSLMQRGASIRSYELMQNGEPAYGGRYHVTLTHALERAAFVAEGQLHAQITYLWGLVDKYRQQAQQDRIAMECALEYIDNTLSQGRDGTRELLQNRLGYDQTDT